MQIKRFEFLRNQFSSYEMKFSEDGNTVEIVNPFGNENVRVEYVPEDGLYSLHRILCIPTLPYV